MSYESHYHAVTQFRARNPAVKYSRTAPLRAT